MTIDEAIADATQRQADVQSRHAACVKHMQDLNAEGVELEKQLIGLAGELKALRGLSEPVTV